MRRKEQEATYGYVPETELGTLHWDPQWLDGVRRSLPEMPAARRRRLRQAYDLSVTQVARLTEDGDIADFFEAAATFCDVPHKLANWMCNEVPAALRQAGRDLRDSALTPQALGELVTLRHRGVLSQPRAKQLLPLLLDRAGRPQPIARARGWLGELDIAIQRDVVSRVLAAHPGPVRRYRAGRHGVLGFLVGQVLQEAQGQGDPERWKQLLRQALDRQ
jgi:aspartyl-tRNA(Asn)/glutamyl-tRNA(Gln) amidotransferase subunit B